MSGRRSSSLRHSKTNGSSSLEASTGEPPPKKSNWEVIEHYHKSGLVGTSTSPRNPPEEELNLQDDDESILHDTTKWWDVCSLCLRVFKSHQFKNIHVEVLYQRYFLRMNQSNLTVLLALLIIVVSSVIGVTVYLVRDSASFFVYFILGCLIFLYAILEILLVRSYLQNEVALYVVSYIILISFFGLELLVMLAPQVKYPSAGLWAAIFFVYVTYIFLPLRLPEATIGGVTLAVLQLTCSASLSKHHQHLWRLVSLYYFI